MSSIFESRKHWLHDYIEASESLKHSCGPSSHSFDISLYSTWKNNRHERKTNPQLRGFKKGLQAYLSSSRHAVQHRNAYSLSGRSDVAMISYHLCITGWLLRKHSHPLNQAAPLRCVRSTKIVICRREFIVMAIERQSAILTKDDACDSGRYDEKTGSK